MADRVLTCDQCGKGLHMRCRGRSAPCRCLQCWSAAIKKDAAVYTSTPIVVELLALLVQRDIRRRTIANLEPVGQGRGGRPRLCILPGCDVYVFGSPRGRRKETCSNAHRVAMQRLRKKDRLLEEQAEEKIAAERAAAGTWGLPAGLPDGDYEPYIPLVPIPTPDGGWIRDTAVLEERRNRMLQEWRSRQEARRG